LREIGSTESMVYHLFTCPNGKIINTVVHNLPTMARRCFRIALCQ